MHDFYIQLYIRLYSIVDVMLVVVLFLISCMLFNRTLKGQNVVANVYVFTVIDVTTTL